MRRRSLVDGEVRAHERHFMTRAWEAYSRLQDHVSAIRDHIDAANACLFALPAKDTIPEAHYVDLAADLDRLAAGIRDHVAATKRTAAYKADAEKRVAAMIKHPEAA